MPSKEALQWDHLGPALIPTPARKPKKQRPHCSNFVSLETDTKHSQVGRSNLTEVCGQDGGSEAVNHFQGNLC